MVLKALRRRLRDLAGRADEELAETLAAQVDAALRGADLLVDALRSERSNGVADALVEVEHDGDARRRHLVSELAHSLTTPIDREDLFRVSRSIDDVLDNLRDFAREFELYQPKSVEHCVPLLESLQDGLRCLREGVRDLTAEAARVQGIAHKTKGHGNEMRRRFEDAVAELFAGELSMDVLKERELLRRLDVVALRLGEAADALADGRMKRM